MDKGRINNTVRNAKAGVIYQVVSIVLPFINRTAIIYALGVEFAGLSGLFTSILQVLNTAELGFSSAIVYSLYRPIAKGDKGKINEIVSLLRRVYSLIGFFILVLGLILMPFIPRLIEGSYPSSINIYILYLLYLINSVLSYFLFAYKECLLVANQRKDVVDNIRTIVNIARYIVQLIVLIIFKNFYLYVFVSIVGTIIANILIHYNVSKRYTYLQIIKTKMSIPKSLKKQVGGIMIGKIGDTCRNSFDSLIISSYLGLTMLAIYGNYYFVYSALTGIMLVISNSMSASVGNSIVEKTNKENYNHLLVFSQLFAFILCITTTCLFTLYQPFMEIWVGRELTLPFFEMLLFCIYYYLVNISDVRNQFINGNGMWDKLKKSYIIEAFANLLLNIILGKFFGISGVIFATIITIFVFNYLQRNRLLFNTYFENESIKVFYKEQFYYTLLTVLSCAISFLICSFISVDTIVGFIIKGVVSVVVPFIVMMIGLKPTKRFMESSRLWKRIIKMILKRKERNN